MTSVSISVCETEGLQSLSFLSARHLKDDTYMFHLLQRILTTGNQNPPISKDPNSLISLINSVFFLTISSPRMNDCQQILCTLFAKREREQILPSRSSWGADQISSLDNDLRTAAIDKVLFRRPDWDYGTEGDRRSLWVTPDSSGGPEVSGSQTY